MADNSYKVSAEVSTANSVTNLLNLTKAVNDTTAALQALNTVTKEGEADLASMAASINSVLASQRQATQSEKELAQAKLENAKATAVQQAADDKHAESLAKIAALQKTANGTSSTAGGGTSAAAASEEQQLASALTARTAAEQQAASASNARNVATNAAKQNELELTDQLSNTRYLLYDVTATYRTMAIALDAIPAATAAVAAAYQADFAQVLRISDQSAASAQSLYDGLLKLTTDIPVSFGEATQIAQLGAHLQLGNDQLVQFTDTVAKFAAATGVDVQSASQMFSRMKTAMGDSAQAGSDYFNKLGSSIAQMGTVVVATDQEVSAMVTQINAITASAGIGTAATVGLAGAMASLRIQPEMARGALTRLFANFNRDSADSTAKMEKFGSVMGMTGQQASQLWKSDPTTFFTDLVAGLNKAYTSGTNLTLLFDQMGIKNVRDVNTLQRLAVGYQVLQKSMAAASTGYDNGTALDTLTQPVFDTLVAKAQELGSAFKALGDVLGQTMLGPLTSFASWLKDVIVGLTDFAKANQGITMAIGILMGLAAVSGVFMGLKAAQAAVLAGLISFQQLLGSSAAGAMSFSGIIKQLAATQLIAKGATEQQAAALLKQATAFGALGIAAKTTTETIAAMDGEAMTFSTLETQVLAADGAMGKFGSTVKGVASSALSLVGGIGGLATIVGVGLVGALMNASSAADNVAQSLGKALNSSAADAAKAAGEAIQAWKVGLNADGGEGFNFGDYGKGLDQIALRAGVSVDKMLQALTKGKQGYEDFRAYLDNFAKSSGFSGGLNDFGLQNSGPGSKGADIYYIATAMDQLYQKSQAASAGSQAVDDSVAKLAGQADVATASLDDTSTAVDSTTSAIDKLDQKLKALNDTVFGTVDAQAALGDALQKLGDGVQKSGSFGNDEQGRANLKDMEDTLAAAQKYYALLQQSGQLTSDQATQGYSNFVDQMLAKTQALGGNTGAIADLAKQTVDQFKQLLGDATSGSNAPSISVGATANTAQAAAAGQSVAATATSAAGSPTVTVGANTANATSQVHATAAQILTYVDSVHPQLMMGVTGDADVQNKFVAVAQQISQITGKPVQFILDALTNPASEHASEVQQYIVDIVNHTYSSTIDANTKPAYDAVTNWYNDAMKKLSTVQNFVNGLSATAPTLSKFLMPGYTPQLDPAAGGVPYKPSYDPAAMTGDSNTQAAPATDPQTQALQDQNAALQNEVDGYNKAQAAAEKAAAKATKGAKDTTKAIKDLSSGIDEATQNADDYASRLKTGLDRAFESQYGLQQATDAYHSKLNEINKARADEIQQVSDLKDKIKQANDEMNKDYVDANKAKIEAAISMKYGEADRANDYNNKAQTALDNAAAKQKEIATDQKQADTIQAGIGLLTGYSDAAIKNRADLLALEQAQLGMVVAYAKTGASVDQVRAYSQKLNAQMQTDVVQAGFNSQAVQNLEGDLNRYVDVINKVPYFKPTTVTADTTPAQDALNGLDNQWQGVQSAMQQGAKVPVTVEWDWNPQQLADTTGNALWAALHTTKSSFNGGTGTDQNGYATDTTNGDGYVKFHNKGGVAEGYYTGGSIVPGLAPSDPNKDNMLGLVDGRRPVGLRSGEGIVNVPAMNYYGGASFLDRLNQMKLPRFAMGGALGSSGSAVGGAQLVELTAAQLAFIADAVCVSLKVDSREIARAANRGNRDLLSDGGRR